MTALYGLTLFVNALLLFLMEPMVGKMILPKLGGASAVWNTCMVFFQAMLLGGYAYAHGASARLKGRQQSLAHLAVLALPLAFVPLSVAKGAVPPCTDAPIGWLLGHLLVGVGVPFFVVASSAPLLQNWFAQTSCRGSRDPYFLYAASNAGSLVGLLGYPLFVEPHLSLNEQSRAWSWGYGLLMVLIGVCAVAMWRSRPAAASAPIPAEEQGSSGGSRTEDAPRPTARDRLWWLALSAIPSSLMLGVTTYVTTDLAAVPLMWVLPLALYLLTFVLVFARRQWIPQALMVKLFPFMVLPMSVLFFFRPGHMEWLVIPAHLLMFFTAAMICHGELVRRRPGARHLTQFYLLMSVGGVLGGLFNTMVAPAVFTRILEYPLVMALACLVLPRTGGAPDSARDRRRDLVLPIILAAVAAGGLLLIRTTILARVGWVPMVLGVGLLLACFTFKARPVRFGLSYVVLLLAILFLGEAQAGNTLYAERNFFGVKRVLLDPSGRLRLLAHGNTTHGCQLVDPSRSREPCSYYHRRGPIGEVFTAFSGQPGRQVGVIGLGSGAVAAYAGPGEHFTFYEIDPAIERIARDRRYFSYLADCRGTCDVVLGDGRLMAARAPDGGFDLFLVDAFNSDSVPTHLLAREAIEVYLRKLSPHGVLAFHVSNRFFDFEPLLARAGEEMGLACMAKFGPALTREELADGKQPARVVVMARRAEELKRLPAAHGWHSVPADKGVRVWTDQYCDVVGLLLRGRRLDLGPRAAVAGGR